MDTETALRLGAFFGIFLAMAHWERGVPLRRLAVSRPRRWATNWAITLIDAAAVRLLFGAAAAGAEHDASYGFNLSLWDRLFGTYVPDPAKGHEGMSIGLAPYQDENPTRLGWSLTLPFFRR